MLLAEVTSDTPANTRSMDIDFGRPLPGYIKVSSGWEDGRAHPGIDLPTPVGTPTYAMQDGVVITADAEGGGDAGKWIAIQHAHGWVSRYMHHSKLLVKKGQVVRRGQQIGLSGNTGLSSGPHLHVDLKLSPEWIQNVQREVGVWGPRGFKAEMNDRIGVPAETWVPVDDYRPDVIARARANNVALYAERKQHQRDTEVVGRALGPWTKAAIGLGLISAAAGAALYLASVGRRPRWGV